MLAFRIKYASAYEGTFTTDSKGTVKISIKQVKPDDSGKPVGTGQGTCIYYKNVVRKDIITITLQC